MKNKTIRYILAAGISASLLGCFSVPHLVMPKKDVASQVINENYSTNGQVLIAARKSSFKEAVIQRVIDSLNNDSLFMKIIGLKQLEDEKVSSFSAIILINTCMSWDMDRSVKRFLKGQTNCDRIIVVTTSAPGDWHPKRKVCGYDGVSSASEDSRVAPAADEILQKVRTRITKQRQ